MGIQPGKRYASEPVEQDNITSRFQPFIDSMADTGNAMGEELGATRVEADSANTGSVQVADEVAALQSRIDALEDATTDAANTATESGSNWTVKRIGKVVTLAVSGQVSNFSMTGQFAPWVELSAPVADGGTGSGRITISTTGGVSLSGVSGGAYTTVTYLTA